MEDLEKDSLHEITFVKMQQDLNVKRKFHYEEYGSMSPLEWLCKEHIRTHKVENFDLVEWKKFRITTVTLDDIYKWVDDDDALFRLLNYFSDNSTKVLADDYIATHPDEMDNFSRKCCFYMNKIYNLWINYRQELTKDGQEPFIGVEYLPDLEIVGGEKEKTPLVQNTNGYVIGKYKRMKVCRAMVCKYFPLYDFICLEYINKAVPYNPHILYSDESILEVVYLIRIGLEVDLKRHLLNPDENTKRVFTCYLNVSGLELITRNRLSREENRLLHGKKEPMLKVFFGLCAYLETDEFTEEEQKYVSPLCGEMRHSIARNSSNKSILSILDECVQAFREEKQKRIEDDLSKEKERADALTVGKIKHDAQHIHNNRDLRIKKLSEVNTELRANLEIRFKGETVQWFWIYRMMADSYIYEHPAYQAFFDELKEAGIDVTKINKSLFTKYYEKVAGDFTLNGWTPRKGMRQSTIDKGEKIAKAARSILYRKN